MTLDSSKVPPESYFEEQAALQLLVPRAKLLAALADAYDAAPVLFVSPGQLSIHTDPDAAQDGMPHGRYLPARKTPAGEFTQPLYALPPATPAVPEALGAPSEVVKAIREYLGVHPDLQLGGQVLDNMALELSRIALDYPADLIGALALEELMQLGYTVEAGAILPPRDLPEQACEFFGVRPVARPTPTHLAGPATYVEARICSICDHIGINNASSTISACSKCNWNGDTPTQDKCPSCHAAGAMTAACPECRSRYILVASTDFAAKGHEAPTAPVPAPIAWPVARDELQRWAQFAGSACRLNRPGDVRNSMEALAGSLATLSARDPARTYVEVHECSGRGCLAQIEGPALSLVERQALDALCAVTLAARHVADDSPYDDNGTVPVEHSDMEALIDALDKLDSLPDDQPGYLMDPAAKAAWALRRLLDAPPALEAPAAIPTVLNIAPRGKSWREGQLIDGTDGYPTRQAMEEAAAPADVGVVFDMVALVKQLVREHRIAEPHSLLAGAAMKYLQRHGLLDSPLRLHSDDAALDRFALAMRAKLAAAREKGRGGWETCPPEVLNRMLHEHIQKGDPLDVANFCMFLWHTGKRTTLPAPAAALASDTALLDAMTQHRIALVPENEGPWDAEVYGDTEATPMARATGATPREALSAALAAMPAAIQGGGAA